MPLIYKPAGPAGEYAKRALNLYKGCTHGCRYCYAPGAIRKSKNNFFAAADPKQIAEKKLQAECAALALNGSDEILLSFIGDPYQPAERYLKLTQQAIKQLVSHGLPFTILTKGGLLALRDFDIYKGYPSASFGTTLTHHRKLDVDFWEPNSAPFKDRLNAMVAAKIFGIRTWVSLEPVIDPAQALQIIRDHHAIVDHWKIGKINHCSAIEKEHDWIDFRETARELLDRLGADYYFKKSLTDL